MTDLFRARLRQAGCLAWLILVAFPGVILAADSSAFSSALHSIREDDLKQYENVLASDTFEGRQAGSRGGRAASIYLREQLLKLNIAGGVQGGYYQEFGDGCRNVIAVLPGSDPELKGQYVVIGAHYDHVGYGNKQNSLGPIGQIHNGADDNASGVSGELEIIQAFTLLGLKPRRSLLFAFWDGEEDGLLGSRYFVRRPTIPMSSIRLMLNVDMIGRLRNNTVQIFGARTGWGLRRFACEQNRESHLRLDFRWEMLGDSDHYPFFEDDVPVLMLHTGKHADYHRPSDDVDKLNFEGMERVSRLFFSMVYEAATQTELPTFRHASEYETRDVALEIPQPVERPLRLGVSWDPETANNGVLRITRLVTGSPAERAGLKIGDRIERFAGRTVNDDSDFRTMVLVAKNPVDVALRREEQEQLIVRRLELGGTPLRVGISWRISDAEPGCVILTQVIPFSPADRADLKVNDRILNVSGAPVTTSEVFLKQVKQSDGPLVLTVERDGMITDKTVKNWWPSSPHNKTAAAGE